MKRFYVLLAFILGLLTAGAQERNDDIEVSLLTCSGGTEPYTLYGHTGLRMNDRTLSLDYVFNYGVFDFNAPHFYWRFVLGETDYILCPIPYREFAREYIQRGSSITEQKLNLTGEEANRLFRMLIQESRPENRTYRYNYLTNNCCTKVRDAVEKAVNGKIVYSEFRKKKTYRQIMHEYTKESLWAQEGNDVLLGMDVDTLLSNRAMAFVPEYMMKAFADARITSETADTRPLVRETKMLAQPGVQLDHPGFWLSPFQCGVVLAVLAYLILLVEFFLRRNFWFVDVVLMTVQGLAGCVLLFVFLFSQHPTLDSNWLIWVLNPLPLFGITRVVRCARQGVFCWWHAANAVLLGLFLVMIPWIPQSFCQSTIPVVLTLLSRPISYSLHLKALKATAE